MGNIDTTALDYRSLTLPKVKFGTKIKRPRKPSLLEIVFLVQCIMNGVFTLLDILNHHYWVAVNDGIWCAVSWKLYLNVRTGRGRISDIKSWFMWWGFGVITAIAHTVF